MKHTIHPRIRPLLAGILAAVYLLTNVSGLYSAETNFWNERREATRRRNPKDVLLAQLPIAAPTNGTTDFIPSFPLGKQGGPLPSSPISARRALPPGAEKIFGWLPDLVAPYGELREVHVARNPRAPIVIHVQDAHEVEEAQRNQAGLIEALQKTHGIDLVGLEGSVGAFRLEPYRAFPNRDINRAVADILLNLGYIGGAEFAGLTAERAPTLWGVEDPDLYAQNLAAFALSEENRANLKSRLSSLRVDADLAAARIYSPALKDFDRHVSAYAKRTESLGDYLRALWAIRPGSPSASPNADLLRRALAAEEKLDFPTVERERRTLVETLARRLSPSALQILVEESVRYRLGRLSSTDYYRMMGDACERNGIHLNRFPHFTAYVAYVKLAEPIDGGALLTELDGLERAAEDRLAHSPEEKAVAVARRRLGLLDKLASHSLTAAEWRSYQAEKDGILHLSRELAVLAERPAPAEGETLSSATLAPFEQFSTFALNRNRALVNRLLAKMKTDHIGTSVLVAGGFHTEGITQLLQRTDVSYAVITPRIKEVPRESGPLQFLVRDPLPLEKLLAGEVIHLASPRPLANNTEVFKGLPGPLTARMKGALKIVPIIWLGAVTALGYGFTGVSANVGVQRGMLDQPGLSLSLETVPLPNKLTAAVVRTSDDLPGVAFVATRKESDFIEAGLPGKPTSEYSPMIGSLPFFLSVYSGKDVRMMTRRMGWLARARRWIAGRFARWFKKVLPPISPKKPEAPPQKPESEGRVDQASPLSPTRLADIVALDPAQWDSLEREALDFVLTQMVADETAIKPLEEEPGSRGLVLHMTPRAENGIPAVPLSVRFDRGNPKEMGDDLFLFPEARGPPGSLDTVVLNPLIFKLDASSLKRHLSTVVREALAGLPNGSFPPPSNEALSAAMEAAGTVDQNPPTWVDLNVPALRGWSIFSRSMESIFNRTLVEILQKKFGDGLLRFLTQSNMTGGLGHVTSDYQEGMGLDGSDVASVFPLWNGIKGVVKHVEGTLMEPGLPPLPEGFETLGDMVRSVLVKTDIQLPSYRLPENTAFWNSVSRGAHQQDRNAFQWQSAKTLALRGQEIQFDVYVVRAKYSGAPIFYLDAFFLQDGKKVRVFDELYADPQDSPWRTVQVAVYSEANQRLIGQLIQKGLAKPKVLTLDHEVFAQFPDHLLDEVAQDHVSHAFNHTVFRPGLWGLPRDLACLVGIDGRFDLMEGNTVSLARAANERAGAVTGVSRIHWGVLLKNLFGDQRHKISGLFDSQSPDEGPSSTNGVLLEHWQGDEIRRLIDLTKEKLRIPETSDKEFYSNLEDPVHQDILNEFKERFQYVKAFYVLDLLLLLHDTQKQPQGGGAWLEESLADVEGGGKGRFTLDNIRDFRNRYQFLLTSSFARENEWWPLYREFGELKEALLKRPIVSNARRQVSYKGPDMIKDIMQSDRATFEGSGVRLLFAGRTFDDGARGQFDYTKTLAQGLGSVAFMENYNSEDARTLYRGVSASLMLSNEFVEAAATSNSKVVVNGGWLIGVFDGADPERWAVLDKNSGNIRWAIQYTHDDLRKGIADGSLTLLNGDLVSFKDGTSSETDGRGAGRRPDQASVLDRFKKLGKTYEAPSNRRDQLYAGLRWSYTAPSERQTRSFALLEGDMVSAQEKVNQTVAHMIETGDLGQDKPFAVQVEDFLFRQGNGFQWAHHNEVVQPTPVAGVPSSPGWDGFLKGLRSIKSKFYLRRDGQQLGDTDGQGLWSLEHHVNNGGKDDLVAHVHCLTEGLPAFGSLRDRIAEMESGAVSSHEDMSRKEVGERVDQDLKILEFVQRVAEGLKKESRLRASREGARSIRSAIDPEGIVPNAEALANRNYEYRWMLDDNTSYLFGDGRLDSLRDTLRRVLTEDSNGMAALLHDVYGHERGGYLISKLSGLWAGEPEMFAAANRWVDEMELVKSDGHREDPATQWRIRLLFSKVLGALDELAWTRDGGVLSGGIEPAKKGEFEAGGLTSPVGIMQFWKPVVQWLRSNGWSYRAIAFWLGVAEELILVVVAGLLGSPWLLGALLPGLTGLLVSGGIVAVVFTFRFHRKIWRRYIRNGEYQLIGPFPSTRRDLVKIGLLVFSLRTAQALLTFYLPGILAGSAGSPIMGSLLTGLLLAILLPLIHGTLNAIGFRNWPVAIAAGPSSRSFWDKVDQSMGIWKGWSLETVTLKDGTKIRAAVKPGDPKLPAVIYNYGLGPPSFNHKLKLGGGSLLIMERPEGLANSIPKTAAAQAEALGSLTLRKRINVPNGYFLVGHSLGAHVSVELALQEKIKKRVRGVALVSWPVPDDNLKVQLTQWVNGTRRTLEFLFQTLRPPYHPSLGRKAIHRTFDLVERSVDMMLIPLATFLYEASGGAKFKKRFFSFAHAEREVRSVGNYLEFDFPKSIINLDKLPIYVYLHPADPVTSGLETMLRGLGFFSLSDFLMSSNPNFKPRFMRIAQAGPYPHQPFLDGDQRPFLTRDIQEFIEMFSKIKPTARPISTARKREQGRLHGVPFALLLLSGAAIALWALSGSGILSGGDLPGVSHAWATGSVSRETPLIYYMAGFIVSTVVLAGILWIYQTVKIILSRFLARPPDSQNTALSPGDRRQTERGALGFRREPSQHATSIVVRDSQSGKILVQIARSLYSPGSDIPKWTRFFNEKKELMREERIEAGQSFVKVGLLGGLTSSESIIFGDGSIDLKTDDFVNTLENWESLLALNVTLLDRHGVGLQGAHLAVVRLLEAGKYRTAELFLKNPIDVLSAFQRYKQGRSSFSGQSMVETSPYQGDLGDFLMEVANQGVWRGTALGLLRAEMKEGNGWHGGRGAKFTLRLEYTNERYAQKTVEDIRAVISGEGRFLATHASGRLLVSDPESPIILPFDLERLPPMRLESLGLEMTTPSMCPVPLNALTREGKAKLLLALKEALPEEWMDGEWFPRQTLPPLAERGGPWATASLHRLARDVKTAEASEETYRKEVREALSRFSHTVWGNGRPASPRLARLYTTGIRLVLASLWDHVVRAHPGFKDSSLLVFGSTARNQAVPESDLDLLIAVPEGQETDSGIPVFRDLFAAVFPQQNEPPHLETLSLLTRDLDGGDLNTFRYYLDASLVAGNKALFKSLRLAVRAAMPIRAPAVIRNFILNRQILYERDFRAGNVLKVGMGGTNDWRVLQDLAGLSRDGSLWPWARLIPLSLFLALRGDLPLIRQWQVARAFWRQNALRSQFRKLEDLSPEQFELYVADAQLLFDSMGEIMARLWARVRRDSDPPLLPVFLASGAWEGRPWKKDHEDLLSAVKFDKKNGLAVNVREVLSPGVLEVLVRIPADRPGILAAITGALAVAHCSVLAGEIVSSNGEVFDRFLVQVSRDQREQWKGNLAMEEAGKKSIKSLLEEILSLPSPQSQMERIENSFGDYRLERSVRTRALPTSVRIETGRFISLMTIFTGERDREGLLHFISRWLFMRGINVRLGRIRTEGDVVLDTFSLDLVPDSLARTLEADLKEFLSRDVLDREALFSSASPLFHGRDSDPLGDEEIDRVLLGGPAGPVSVGRLNVDVNNVRNFVGTQRERAREARDSLAMDLGSWNLTGRDGQFSETSVLNAGRALARAIGRMPDSPPPVAQIRRKVSLALMSLGEVLQNASINDWNRWANVFARGFNENLFEAEGKVLASIQSRRRLMMEVSQTMLSGKPTEEDKTRLTEWAVLAKHTGELAEGKLQWILPNETSNLDAFLDNYPDLAPLKSVQAPVWAKSIFMGEDGKYSVKQLLLAAQGREKVEDLDAVDLYLVNRDEWVVESDLPKSLVRIIISLVGDLVFDATEKVGNDLKRLFFLKINA